MWVVYALIFFATYTCHCIMARKFLEYYSARYHPFHFNLAKWNKDIESEVVGVSRLSQGSVFQKVNP